MGAVLAFIILILLFVFMTFCWLFLKLSHKQNTFDSAEEIIQLLQQSSSPWCLILLNGISDETVATKNPPLIGSKLFFEFLGQSYTNFHKTVLSWPKIIQALGPESDSTFQQGIRHLVRFGGSFSCNVHLHGKDYVVEGTLIQSPSSMKSPSLNSAESFKDHPFSDRLGNPTLKEIPFQTEPILNPQRCGIFLTLKDQTQHYHLEKELIDFQDSNEKLKTILNTLPFPVWTRSSEDKIDFCNKAYAKILGTHPTHVISNQWEIVDTAQARKLKELHHRVLEKGAPESIEISTIRKNTDHILRMFEAPIMVPAEPFLKTVSSKPHEVLKYTIGCAIDLSEERTITQTYQNLAKTYQQVLEQINMPFVIFDHTSKLTLASACFLEIFEMTQVVDPQRLFCDDLLDWLRDNRKLPEYIAFASIKEKFQKWIQGISLAESELWHLPNGAILNISAVRYPTGGAIIIVQDVTQTLTLEGRYKSLLAVYNEIIEQSHDALLIIGTDHRIRLCSQSVQSILNVKTNDLMGVHVKDFIHTFAQDHNLPGWEESICTAIELRNHKTEYVTFSQNEVMVCDYTPLSDGGHLLRFTDPAMDPKIPEESSLFQVLATGS